MLKIITYAIVLGIPAIVFNFIAGVLIHSILTDKDSMDIKINFGFIVYLIVVFDLIIINWLII